MRNLLLFLPTELLPLLIATGGIALILGARKFATGLFVLAAAIVFLPFVLEPLMEALPTWLLIAVIVSFALSMAFGTLRWMLAGLIGKGATDHVVGDLVARGIRKAFTGAFLLPVLVARLLLATCRAIARIF